jgi:hypothetical protein
MSTCECLFSTHAWLHLCLFCFFHIAHLVTAGSQSIAGLGNGILLPAVMSPPIRCLDVAGLRMQRKITFIKNRPKPERVIKTLL